MRVLAGLVALDFVLGVSAAIKLGSFRLAYLADFLRADVLGKLVPYYGIWAVLHVVGDIQIAGIDTLEEASAAAIGLALAGSVLKSAKDLGIIPAATSDTVAGPDPTSPL